MEKSAAQPKADSRPTLWGAAVSLCQQHSVLKVSRALRLNYSDLKERFEHSQRPLSKRPFVELGNHPFGVAPAPKIVVDCDDGRRHRMRIHCSGPMDCAVVDLVQGFFGTDR